MQYEHQRIDRNNIADSIASDLRNEIMEGRLRAGERINEVHLAAAFGVSRTPLREALGRLVAEDAVASVARRGFFVTPLSLEEFKLLYPIRSILDPGALQLAGIPSTERLNRLAVLNKELVATKNAYARIRLDEAWHLELVAQCGNRILIDLIKQFMLRTRRYELALMREEFRVLRSVADHHRILRALRAGNLAKACNALGQNMAGGSTAIVAWLKSRSSRLGNKVVRTRSRTRSVLRVAITAASFLLAFDGAVIAQERTSSAESIVGLWGSEQLFGPHVRGELTIDARGTPCRAAVSGFDVPVEERNGAFAFKLPGNEGRFHGRLRADRRMISGQWIQPRGIVYQSEYVTPVELTEIAKSVWSGRISPLDETLSLYLSVQVSKDGALTALIRNPEFNYLSRRSYRAELANGNVTLSEMQNRGEPLKGTFDAKSDRLSIQFPDNPKLLDFTRRNETDAVGFLPRSPVVQRYVYRAPIQEKDGWQTADLTDVGLDPKKLSALIQKLINANPNANPFSYIHSLLIARRDKLVLEEYFYGFTKQRVHDMRSASKTFAPLLIGIAIDRGAKITPDTPIYSLFPEYKEFANSDERKQKIAVRHLMSMASGYACDDNSDSSPGNEDTMQQQGAQPDWYKYTLDLPMAGDPGGEHAVYCSASMNLLGGIVHNSTGTWLPEFFCQTVACPLEIKSYYLNVMPSGDGYMGGGLYLRPRDELKLGQLYLCGGVWNGHRIVSKHWVQESLTRHSVFEPNGNLDHEYGYGWHIHHLKMGDRSYLYYEAGGNGGQFVLVVPELELVVGMNGGNYGEFPIWSKWAPEMLADYIIPAVLDSAKKRY
jgi:DNA-binding GntR family transcriptional regulator/CubicO group peptidase (beta-lactamase class C family)